MRVFCDPKGVGARSSSVPFTLKWLTLCLALVTSLALAATQDPEDQFMSVYNLILQGDSLTASGKKTQALAKYEAAQTELLKLAKKNPNWNSSVVSFRLDYLARQIAALSETPKAGAERAAGDTQSRPPPARAAGQGEVRLLDPGAEPRQVLRLHPKAGDKQTTSMELKLGMNMKLGDVETPMKLPAMNMTMDVTVQSVSPEGDITYQMVMGDTTVSEEAGTMPQVADAIKAALGGVKGLSSTLKISNRGVSRGVDMSVPSGADPQMRQALDQMKESFARMAAPLPEEPVGKGARWESKTPVKSQGMTINQAASYELVSIDGEQINVKSTVTQHAANQKIENPAMPGVKLDLTKMAGSGTGDMVINLGQVVPVGGKLDFHTDLSMGMNLGNQNQSMNMKMDIGIRLQSK